GLERVGEVARRMALLPVAVPVVTIAGTNGKGTTAAALEALLIAGGRRPGTYTSPHLLRFNERIRVAGQEVGDEAIVAAFDDIESARGDTSLTYFEFATLAALWVFRDSKADVLVLEAGLGGRLDAVNIVDPAVAVITGIALDHQDWLGDDLDAIAREKAGILRRDGLAVIADAGPPPGLRAAVEAAGARALFAGRDFHWRVDSQQWQAQLQGRDGARVLLEGIPASPLLPSNLCAALQALLLLGDDPRQLAVADILGKLRVPGRRQSREVAGRHYILDVAHNPQAIEALLEYIASTPCFGKTIAIFSAMRDKDLQGMLSTTSGVFDAWFLADQPDNRRSADASDIADVLRDEGEFMLSVSKNLRQAFRRAQSVMAEGDRLVVFGSFFTVAAVLPLLEKEEDRTRS
ncbi:MAG: bifunctional folylpolyglutamate synthase/dihydrofolate synthase, partial [Parahaliea sp.]